MSLLDLAFQDGRPWARIGDRFGVTRKPRSIRRHEYETLAFFPMDVIPQGGAYAPDRFVVKAPGEITSGTYFERGDVLVAKITPSFENGKQALIDSLEQPYAYATTEVIPLHALTAKDDPRFLFFYLLHPDIRHYVAERMEGSTGRQRVSEELLLNLPMPDIGIVAQSQAADALELIHVAATFEKNAIAVALETKAAAMKELFTRGLRSEAQKATQIGPVPESWQLVPLGELGRIGNGSTPKRSTRSYWDEGNFPWLNSAKVYDRDIREAEQFVTDLALRECHLPVLEPGAVLVAITGQGKTLGHAAVLSVPATINQHLAYLQPDLERAEPKFIRGYLETQYEYLRAVASGGGSTKGALTCGFLRGMIVPMPPTLEEQQEIVAALDAIDRKIDLHRRKREVLDQLFESLLHKLLTGDVLVGDLDFSALHRINGRAS
ncbi:restriction endonuclease subunit S [Arthrobacter sp. C152]